MTSQKGKLLPSTSLVTNVKAKETSATTLFNILQEDVTYSAYTCQHRDTPLPHKQVKSQGGLKRMERLSLCNMWKPSLLRNPRKTKYQMKTNQELTYSKNIAEAKMCALS